MRQKTELGLHVTIIYFHYDVENMLLEDLANY